MSKRKRFSFEYKNELVELVRRSQSSCRKIVSVR
jgi:transposase